MELNKKEYRDYYMLIGPSFAPRTFIEWLQAIKILEENVPIKYPDLNDRYKFNLFVAAKVFP